MNKWYALFLSIIFLGNINVYAQNFNQDPGNPNLDFSMGDFTNWQLSWGPLSNPELTPGAGGPSTHVIVENYGNNWDANAGIGSLPRVPSGLDRVARLGHPAGNGYGNPASYKLKYTITVDSDYPILFFQIASLMDFNHSNSQNTHYKFALKNSSGENIPTQPCTGLELFPTGSEVPMSNSVPPISYPLTTNFANTYQYHKWESVAIDLSAYAGQSLSLEFEHSDCWKGYHGSYTYLSAAMRKEVDTIYYCKEENQITVTPYLPRFDNYLWNTGSTAENITINNPADGEEYHVTVGSYNGCNTTLRYVLKEYPVDAGFSNVSIGCNELSFTDNTYSPLTNITSWQWSFGDSSPDNSSSDQNPSHIYSDTGNYLVTLTVETQAGCTDTYTEQVHVSSGGSTGFIYENGCLGDTTSFTDTSLGTITSHFWNFGDGTTSAEQDPKHVYSGIGTYTVTLITQNAAGCTDTVTHQITIIHPPTSSFIVPDTLFPGESAHFINTSQHASNFVWEFGTGEQSFLTHPEYIYNQTGEYLVTLIASNDYGCVDSSLFIVNVVYETTVIPNVFTPNGDGINDFFSITLTAPAHCDVAILNRWGNIVYSFNGNLNSGTTDLWNGTSGNSAECADGVYFYKVSFSGITDLTSKENTALPSDKEGFITLMR